MDATDTTTENFLIGFHDARPGLTPKAFGARAAIGAGRVHASSYQLLADLVPRNPEPACVLDLACGDGHLLSLLQDPARPALSAFGVDLSAGELGVASGRAGLGGRLVRGRAQALPFADARFDMVLCHMALMLMSDVASVIAEIRRVLKPGGLFAAVIGINPPPSPVLAHYIGIIRRLQREPRWQSVRIGDGRIRSEAGIAELFADGFCEPVIDEFSVPLRLSPAALWDWLLDMYDLYLLAERERERVRRELMEAVAAECGADGMFDFPQALRVLRLRVS